MVSQLTEVVLQNRDNQSDYDTLSMTSKASSSCESSSSSFMKQVTTYPARKTSPYDMLLSSVSHNINSEEREPISFKRRKIDELQYAASQVQDDLKKGGLACPVVDVNMMHLFDFEKPGVELLSAKAVSSSPFLSCEQSATTTGVKRSLYTSSMREIGDLFAATYSSYAAPGCSGRTEQAGDWSSYSSMTSDGNNSPKVAIPPLLEDVINHPADEMKETELYSKPITIGDAFANSSEARLVTLSFAPFVVVYVNSAYTAMTGLAPKDVLGHPMNEIIEDQKWKFKTSPVGLHEFCATFKSKDHAKEDSCYCHINVAVVGPEERPSADVKPLDKSEATHFMISLKSAPKNPMEPPAATSTTSSISFDSLLDQKHKPLVNSLKFHCNVMG